MAPTHHQHAHHARHHQLQLFTRILNTRPGASPFTLILDSLSQRAWPLVGEITRRAISRSIRVILISSSVTTSAKVHSAITRLSATLPPAQLLGALRSALAGAEEGALVILDTLPDVLAASHDLSALAGALGGSPKTSLLAIYHTDLDIPTTGTTTGDAAAEANPYAPSPLALARYMATAILRVRSFAHVVAEREAARRSVAVAADGMDEGEGVVIGLLAGGGGRGGVVVEGEFRRRSGRDEEGVFFLRAPREGDYKAPGSGEKGGFGVLREEFACLLGDVEGFGGGGGDGGEDKEEEVQASFNLGLTEKQREAREGVVLPYFDAQKGEGAGEGGRILYDMGEEDDFDEEEDEI